MGYSLPPPLLEPSHLFKLGLLGLPRFCTTYWGPLIALDCRGPILNLEWAQQGVVTQHPLPVYGALDGVSLTPRSSQGRRRWAHTGKQIAQWSESHFPFPGENGSHKNMGTGVIHHLVLHCQVLFAPLSEK